jgi:hypothetical protein
LSRFGAGWALRRGYAPVVVLIEEAERAPSVPATDEVSVEKPQS